MAGMIIWTIVTFGCAILFYSIGAYALKSDKPVNFYSGTEVDPSEITDIKQYNQENSRLWKTYSLWYTAAGVTYYFNVYAAVTLLVLSCTVGIVILVKTYNKIYNKYKV